MARASTVDLPDAALHTPAPAEPPRRREASDTALIRALQEAQFAEFSADSGKSGAGKPSTTGQHPDGTRKRDLPALIAQYQALAAELVRLGHPHDAERVREIAVQLQRFIALGGASRATP